MDDKQKKTLTDEANASFQPDLSNFLPTTANSNVPAATPEADVPAEAAAAATGGLSYATATADEKKIMDAVIGAINLQDPESIINLGARQRDQLAKLSDQILDSIQPSVKVAFVEALKNLLDVLKDNSLDNIKKRLGDAIQPLKKAFFGLFVSEKAQREREEKHMKKMVEAFMTDISGSRKIISEMVDKLQAQQTELNKNYVRINQLGQEIVKAAQEMRIIRAASAEYIRRVNDGEITVLQDLQAIADKTRRADDIEKLQVAQANWGNLQVVDGDLLASINVYDMNVANLAFTKQANLQNRMQTASALTTTVSEWKAQLAMFAIVTTETMAVKLLDAASEMTKKSVEKNVELFEMLVDLTVGRAAKGAYSLRDIITAQDKMATKLEGIGDSVEASFKQLAEDKKALEASSEQFKKRTIDAYKKNDGGFLSPKAPGL